MKRICYLIFLSLVLCVKLPAQNFKREEVLEIVKILSHDSLEGRQTGTRGNLIARDLIEEYYKMQGLKPFPDNQGYFHFFELPKVKATNILGFIPGTRYPESFIIISAHYDHLGKMDGKIFNGADDNASGVGGILAAIQYFTKNPPKNSLIFAAFDAEEIDLLGSKEFVRNPPIPLNKILLNINLDMISRSDKKEIYACGTRYYPYLRPLLEKSLAKDSSISLKFGHDSPDPVHPSNDWTLASDHGPFHKRDIPFVYFGVEDHEDYHRPTDKFEKIDQDFYLSSIQLIIRSIETIDQNSDIIKRERKKTK